MLAAALRLGSVCAAVPRCRGAARAQTRLRPLGDICYPTVGRGALEEILPLLGELNHASMLAAAAALHAEGITFAPGGSGAAGAAGRLPGRRVVAWQRRFAPLDGGGTEPLEDVPYVLVHLMARRRPPV